MWDVISNNVGPIILILILLPLYMFIMGKAWSLGKFSAMVVMLRRLYERGKANPNGSESNGSKEE